MNEQQIRGVGATQDAESYADQKALRKSKGANTYHTKRFVLRHSKKGRVVEVSAVSAFQAAKLMGWRPRHTILVDVLEDKQTDATTGE